MIRRFYASRQVEVDLFALIWPCKVRARIVPRPPDLNELLVPRVVQWFEARRIPVELVAAADVPRSLRERLGK